MKLKHPKNMSIENALGYLADIETFLSCCQHNAMSGSKAERQYDARRQAVNVTRAHIISEMATEDDGK